MDQQLDDPFARFEELDRVVAQIRVRPPGVALMIVGGLWTVSGLAALAGGGLYYVSLEGRDDTGMEATFTLIILLFAGLFGASAVAAGGVTAWGGYHLSQLRSRRWAVGGTLAAIVSGVVGFAFCVWGLLTGAFGCFGLMLLASAFMGVPVGIWASVVLRDDLVKAAFR